MLYLVVGAHVKRKLNEKYRQWFISFAVLIIGHLVLTDYQDFSWSNNAGISLGIKSMILSNRQ